MDPLLVSVEEAARLLGLGRSAAYELLARGDLPRVKVGRRTLVPVRALSEWVERAALASAVATEPVGRPELLSVLRPLQRTA